jgi:hypothetical protein
MGKHNVKSKTNYRQAMEENTLMQRSEQKNKQTNNKDEEW